METLSLPRFLQLCDHNIVECHNDPDHPFTTLTCQFSETVFVTADFDKLTKDCMVVNLFDGDDEYQWVDYRQQNVHQPDEHAGVTVCDNLSDMVDKIETLFSGKCLDGSSLHPLDLPPHMLYSLMMDAHHHDMQFNQYLSQQLLSHITQPEPFTMNKPELISSLSSNTLTITFAKKDGSQRVMKCTLQADKLPGEALQPTKDTVITVYDVTEEDWRSIDLTRIVSVA